MRQVQLRKFPGNVRRIGACVALALSPLAGYAASTPYSGTAISLPGTIQAANFDKGGQGVAYNDLTTGNLGGLYRTTEDVDIYASTDTAGGPYQVASFQTGEWMAYTVNVATSGSYDVAIRASNNFSSNAAFHIEVDGVNVTGSVNVPMTGSWSTYQAIGKRGLPLSAGQHVIKLVADAQYFNVSAITVAASAGSTTSGSTASGSATSSSTPSSSVSAPSYAGTPYTGTPIALPLAFQAANFDKGGQGVAYNDLTKGNLGGLYRTSEDVDIYASTDTIGGPYQIANFQTGEWLNYTVNVPANGNYDISVRTATNFGSPTAFHVEVDGQNVTGSLPVPKTGSWSTYQWVGKTGVPLTAGKHVLKVVSDAQYFNFNAVSVLASASTTTSGGTTSGGTTSGGTTSGGTTSGGTTSGGTTSGGTTTGGTTTGGTTTGGTTTGGTTTGVTGGVIYAGTPYAGTAVTVPATIMAANYDKGGEGVAYHDMTAGNAGGLYRTSENVDITSSTDSGGGGYALYSFQTGEWVNYTVNVPTAGNYDLGVRASTNYSSPTAFHMEVDGSNVTGSVPVPSTAGWTAFQPIVGKTGVPLTAGTHVIKVAADAQYFNMSALTVAASGSTTTTSTGSSGSTSSGGTTSSSGSTSSSTPPPGMLFWSGYEGTSAALAVQQADCYGTGCWQKMGGTDSTTNVTWPMNVWGGAGQFQLLPDFPIDATTVGNYMYNKVQTVTGHKGTQTQAMYRQITQTNTGTGPANGPNIQNPYLLLPASEQGDMYISQWVMLQPDLATKLKGTWRDLFEWKTGGDYRVELTLQDYNGTGTPIWQVRGDNDANGGLPYQEFWKLTNSSIPIPIGQWFKLEIFWHRSTGSDGRVWFGVNGQKLFDHMGPNIGVNNAPITRIMLNQLYSGSSYPIYQWMDDVQVWSTFPTATSGNAWYDPPYAPH